MATPLPVEVLPRDEAAAFLRVRAGRPGDPYTEALAAALGDLPLALEQAGAYVEQTHGTLGGYLELFTERDGELLGMGGPIDYRHTVATTWTMALERVRAEVPAAENLLNMCSFLAPDDLPRPLLREHAEQLPDRLRQAAGDRLAFDQTLGALGRYSLATVSEHTLAVHRLVQTVRQNLGQAAARAWAGAAVRLMEPAFPRNSHDVRTWPECARLLPTFSRLRAVSPVVGRLLVGAVVDRLGTPRRRHHRLLTHPPQAAWWHTRSSGDRADGAGVPVGYHQVVGLLGVRSHTSKKASRSWPDTSS